MAQLKQLRHFDKNRSPLLTPRLRGPRAAALSNTPLKNPAHVPYRGIFSDRQKLMCLEQNFQI